MVERDIEPVDPKSYSAFTSFFENINDSDPLRLDKLTNAERMEYLENPRDKLDYKSGLVAQGIIAEARTIFSSPTYISDGEILAMRMGLKISYTERKYILDKTEQIVKFMKDNQSVATFFEKHDIDKANFSFERVEYGNGSMMGPDSFGFNDTLNDAIMITTVELDRRLQRPYSRESQRQQFLENYTKTGQDLTGLTYLRLIHLQKSERLYREVYSMDWNQELDKENIQKILAGMSYPSSLFVVDKYSEIVDEYLGLIS